MIVVGAGVAGGLPAATYLQRAGLEVALVERAARPAGFFSSYERGPGLRFDVAPVNFSCMSPALVDLELASYGYRIDFPEARMNKVKSVRMDVKSLLVAASADPVIEVSDQRLQTDALGKVAMGGKTVAGPEFALGNGLA